MPKTDRGRGDSSTAPKPPRSPSTGRVQKNKQTNNASAAIAKVDGIDENLLHPDYQVRSPIITRNAAAKAAQKSSGEGTSTGTFTTPVSTSNKFAPLSDESEDDDDDDINSSHDGDLEPSKTKVEQNKKQPIIHVPATPWEKVVESLNGSKCDYAAKLSKSSVQIHTMNRSKFEEVQRVLKAGGVEYYTFDSPQSKPVKIVMSGYMAEPVEELKKDLADYNITPREIKILSRKQTDLGEQILYLLFFERGSFKIQDLRRIKIVHGYLVHWRYFAKRPNDAAQCHRCQRFGHGSRNCTLSPKCVKCGKNHLTADCTLPRRSRLQENNNAEQNKPLVKCTNCSGNHTANYRGCPARKTYIEEIEKKKKKSSRLPPKPTVPTGQGTGPTDKSAQPPGWGRSFADMVASAGNSSSAPDASAADGNLFTVSDFLCLAKDMFERLNGCRSKLEQFMALGELMLKYITK